MHAYILAHVVGMFTHIKMLRQPEAKSIASIPLFGMFVSRVLFGFPIFLVSLALKIVMYPVVVVAWVLVSVCSLVSSGRTIKFWRVPSWPLIGWVSAKELSCKPGTGIIALAIPVIIAGGVVIAVFVGPPMLFPYLFVLVIATEKNGVWF